MSDYVCEELIVEIFKRLPPKSLLRFRSLSKSLYSCIGSPDFIRMHYLRSPQKFLFRHRNGHKISSSDTEDDFYTLHGEDELPLCPTRGYNGITSVKFPCSRNFSIVGSCNGIFCLLEYQNGISLWNPSIRCKLSLPYYPLTSLVSWTGLGFGFNQITDDYLIVWISHATESSFVYSVKTGTWYAVSSPTPFISKVLLGTCFVNGTLHWVVDSYHTESHHINFPCIMTFDLSTHVFGMILMPEPFTKATGLTTLEGSLAVISTDNNDDSWIWVRRDDTWSLDFKSKAYQFKGGAITGVLQPKTNGDLLLNTRMDGVQVYNYKMGAQTQSRLVDFHAESTIFEIVPCVEALHLLDMVIS